MTKSKIPASTPNPVFFAMPSCAAGDLTVTGKGFPSLVLSPNPFGIDNRTNALCVSNMRSAVPSLTGTSYRLIHGFTNTSVTTYQSPKTYRVTKNIIDNNFK